MASQKREELLSNKEKERLRARDSLDPRTRAANDSRAKRKLEAWFKNIIDVEEILEHLPDDQIRDVIDDRDIYSLLYTAETLLKIQKFHPVGGAVGNPDRWSVIIDKDAIMPAEDTDILRSKLLGELLDHLDRFVLVNENPVCRLSKLEKLERMGLGDRIKADEMTGLRKLKQASMDMVSRARRDVVHAREAKLHEARKA
jgi:hypothetical protein